MKVVVPAAVLAELADIAAYIAIDNRTAANAVMGRIEKLFDRLSLFPYMANETDESGVRSFNGLRAQGSAAGNGIFGCRDEGLRPSDNRSRSRNRGGA